MATTTERRRVVTELVIQAGQYTKALRNIDRSTARSAKRLQEINTRLGNFGSTLRSIAGVAGISLGVQGIADFVRATAEVERLDAALKASSGSAEAFARSIRFLGGTADRYGISQAVLTDTYTRLSAAAREVGLSVEEVEKQFEALATTSAAFQLSASDVEGIVLGWQQSIGSATINMEDLRQVADRIPGGLALATQAFRNMTGQVNASTKDFKEFVAAGQVPIELMGEFARVLEEAFGEQALANANTFNAELNRLRNAFFEFNREVAESGFLSFLADGLAFLKDIVVEVQTLKDEWPSARDIRVNDIFRANEKQLNAFDKSLNKYYDDVLARQTELMDLASSPLSFGNREAFAQEAESFAREADRVLNLIKAVQEQRERLSNQGINRVLDPDLQGKRGEKIGERGGLLPATGGKTPAEELEEYGRQILLARKETEFWSTATAKTSNELDLLSEYTIAYNEALVGMGVTAEKATSQQLAFAEAAGEAAKAIERASQAAQEASAQQDFAKDLAQGVEAVSKATERVAPARTANERRYRETFGEDLNLSNYTLKVREFAADVAELPADEARKKATDLLDSLAEIGKEATGLDIYGIQRAAQSIAELSDALAGGPLEQARQDRALEDELGRELAKVFTGQKKAAISVELDQESLDETRQEIEEAEPVEVPATLKWVDESVEAALRRAAQVEGFRGGL